MARFLGDVAKYLLDEMSGADYRRFATSVKAGLDALAKRFGHQVVDVLATALVERSKMRANPGKHVAGARCTCPVCRSPKMPIDDARWN